MSKAITTIYESVRSARNESGESQLPSKVVAKLIKARLAEEFPTVRFSVTSDYNSILIRWENGPPKRSVRPITDQYSFGGFDPSIDLAYSSKNWLHPDGSMTHAETRGTSGSLGCVPASATDCPVPGALLVSGGPKYIHLTQNVALEYQEKASRTVVEMFGGSYDPALEPMDQRIPSGESLWHDSLCRHYNDTLDLILLESL